MTAVEIPISTPITISDGSQSRNGATSTPSFGSPATTKTAIAMINAVAHHSSFRETLRWFQRAERGSANRRVVTSTGCTSRIDPRPSAPACAM